MTSIYRKASGIATILVAGFAASACRKVGAESNGALDPQKIGAIATEAYVFGYPLVTMDLTRRVMTNTEQADEKHAPMGQFANMRAYPDPSFHDITAPNANTLYSVAWIDVGKEPYVLALPDEQGRYYLMPMLSAWTDVFRVPGTRTTGTGPQRYLIVGPSERRPPNVAGATLVRSPTALVWILGRTFAQGSKEDVNAVHELQDQYTLVPMSAYDKSYKLPDGHVDASVDMKTPVRDQVNALDAATFFDRLAALMNDNPPAPGDSTIVKRMASIGIVAGEPFDTTKLGTEGNAELKDVPKRAREQIVAYQKNVPVVNGWNYSTETGTYGTDYDRRAYTTYVGLGANLPQDAVYPFTDVDANLQPLDGSKRYVLHFDKGAEPPVKGFWSITMYDPHYFFVANPINRYQISPKQSPVTYNADGSLDLYIQHASPGAAKAKNWLPAPAGGFILMMRMYEPENAVLTGGWKPPGVQQVPIGIAKSSERH